MPNAGTEGGDGVRSVVRALELLALFDESHRSRSVRELTDATGLPKSTVVRLVATLEQNGLVWTRTDGRLTPGAGLLRWAQLAHDAWQLPPEAVECLRELSSESGGESSRIYVRQGLARLCVAQHEGTQQLRHVVRIGEVMPLWAGASGHVLLAGCSPKELHRAAMAADLGPEFESTLVGRVDRAATQNWAVSHGEREDGVSAVAAPITGTADEIVAAVSLGGPTNRFTGENVRRFLPSLSRAAAQLSELRFIGGGS